MLYADNHRIDELGTQISWRPLGTSGGKLDYLNIIIEYSIIDKAGQKVIQSGSFVLR